MKEKANKLWNFDAPDYDKRSSSFVNAGTHHGVGKTQPVGSLKHSNKEVIPCGHPHEMRVDIRG